MGILAIRKLGARIGARGNGATLGDGLDPFAYPCSGPTFLFRIGLAAIAPRAVIVSAWSSSNRCAYIASVVVTLAWPMNRPRRNGTPCGAPPGKLI